MSKLHVDSILKRFGDKQILTDVFLSCTEGEIIGLVGRNGVGKSTLLKIIFGALNAETKFVKVDNKLIKSVKDSTGLVAYLPQDNFLPNHIKISTLIKLFCDADTSQFISSHKLIEPMLYKYAKQLSGGERRLLEVFLMIFSKAKFVLIDEPFNGIAPVYKDEIKRLVKEQSKYKGFIITDHDYRNVLEVASKTILLYDGGTKVITSTEDLSEFGYIP